MYGQCDSCGSKQVHVRKFPEFGNKKFCRGCSETNLSHSIHSKKDFSIQHLSQVVGQLFNQLDQRMSIIEQKLKIESDNKFPVPVVDKDKK